MGGLRPYGEEAGVDAKLIQPGVAYQCRQPISICKDCSPVKLSRLYFYLLT
jgi:hypothetical protein